MRTVKAKLVQADNDEAKGQLDALLSDLEGAVTSAKVIPGKKAESWAKALDTLWSRVWKERKKLK